MASPISELHQAALDYAAQGIAVFPCIEGGKRPATAHGWKDATTDPAQINAWWTENPRYNLAIYPESAGWCVVDLDGAEGLANWERLCAEHGAIDTYTIKTPSGGQHKYFAGSLPPTASRIAPGIDTRGAASYVLVPPSSVDGGSYEASENETVAVLPAWIGGRVASNGVGERTYTADTACNGEQDLPHNVERARQLLARYVDKGHFPGREEPFDDYAVCCEILNLGISEETALSLFLTDWAPAPHSADLIEFLETTLANAARYAQNEPGAWAVPSGAELWPDAAALAPRPSRSRFYPLDWGEQAALPEPRWLFPDFIPADSTVMFYGQPGSFKSFLALDVALTIASGVPGFQRPASAAQAVVYAAGEGPRGISRLRAPAWSLVHQPPETPLFYLVPDVPWVSQPEMVPEFIKAVEDRGVKPKLVILDTAANAMTGMNENDARDAGLFIAAVEAIKRHFGCTVLVVHHSGKDGERGARGSSALMAGFDAVYEVKATEGTKAVALYCRKQKDADRREAPLTFEGKPVGNSLVFQETTPAQHKILAGTDDRYDPKAVGKILADLKAYGQEAGVTTRALAVQMFPESSTDADRGERRLRYLAGNSLVAYAMRIDRELVWCLPATA